MTISFQTFFNLDTLQASIEDLSVYSNPSDIQGFLSITGPSGVVYSNTGTPDVLPGTSVYSGNINLPVDKHGFVQQGIYTFTYTVKQISTGLTFTQTNTYNYTFLIPLPYLAITPDGYSSTFSVVDDTEYGVPASMTMTLTVTPPSGSGLPTQTTSGNSITYSPNIWSGNWTTTISTILSYNSGGIIINFTLSQTIITPVLYIDMNVIRGYIESLRLDFYTALGQNRNLAETLKNKILLVEISSIEYLLALKYNDLLTAYKQAVNMVYQLTDYFTNPVQEITPYVDTQQSILSPTFAVTFTTSQLSGTNLTINLPVVSQAVSVSLSNNSGVSQSTSGIVTFIPGTNVVTLNMAGFMPFTGTWRCIVAFS